MKLFRRRREEQDVPVLEEPQMPLRRLPIAASDARTEGDRCRDQGLWEEASSHYRRHLEEYPADIAIWVQLGNCLKEASSLEEARSAYWRAIALEGGDSDILLQFGHVQKLMGRHDEAAEAYRASLSRQPEDNPAAGELEHLLSAPPPAVVPSRVTTEIEARLSVLEAQLPRLIADSPERRHEAHIAVVAASRLDVPAINVLVDGAADTFLHSLLQALLAGSRTGVRLVRWNRDTKQFQVLDEPSAVHPGPLFLAASQSCGPQDWLLVPTGALTGETSELYEMNVVLAARQLGLRTAFIFRGADPLRFEKSRGRAAEVCERYMQSLILADAIVSVSTLAANDLRAFLTQHQCADKGPPIRRLLPPVDDDAEAWAEYARRLRGLLADIVDATTRIPGLYFVVDGGTPSMRSPDWAFIRLMARTLSEQGTALIPARWDSETGRLVEADMAGEAWEGAGGPRIWSGWTEPEQATAPSWIFEPDAAAASADRLDATVSFARAYGLRVAAILSDLADGETAGRAAIFRALARADKVLSVSSRAHRDFQSFLLASRERLHSAEDRFKRLAPPSEQIGPRRRSIPRASRPGVVEALIVAPKGGQGLSTVLEAALEATHRFAGRLTFSVIGETKGLLPSNVRWLGLATDAAFETALAAADFAIWLDADIHERLVTQCLAYGVPCLVPSCTDFGVPANGVAFADLSSKPQAVDAIVRLCDTDWRRCLSREATSTPVHSWDDFVSDIGAELVNDRLAETLHVIEPRPTRNVYSLLPNLRPRPRLSLCISTYNRAGWLQVNLRNIFSQIPNPRADLEVLVVDNTSTDHTPEVVATYLDRPDFRYLRNSRNVGMLGNLAVTAQKARGDYVWILGDDDLTRPGVIERALQIIDDHPGIALVYMNYGYTSEANPGTVVDLAAFLGGFNVLEPAGPDHAATVKELAAKCENFFTAIYSHIYRRDHALRAYCQDTSGRIFATMLSCVPTAYYVLNYMADEPAYWIGEQALVVNSNVSWQAYGVLLDLEQLPRTWDLAERMGTAPQEVDTRRANRLWLVEMMWREIFGDDPHGNSDYFSAARVLTRLKHLAELDKHIPEFVRIYRQAQAAGHPAARLSVEDLFSAFKDIVPPADEGASPQ